MTLRLRDSGQGHRAHRSTAVIDVATRTVHRSVCGTHRTIQVLRSRTRTLAGSTHIRHCLIQLGGKLTQLVRQSQRVIRASRSALVDLVEHRLHTGSDRTQIIAALRCSQALRLSHVTLNAQQVGAQTQLSLLQLMRAGIHCRTQRLNLRGGFLSGAQVSNRLRTSHRNGRLSLLNLRSTQHHVRFQQGRSLRNGLQRAGQVTFLQRAVLGGNLLHRGTQLRQTLSQSLNSLRCLLLQVAQLSQLSVLLLSNAGDFLRVINNLSQPGTLLSLGIRDAIGQELLTLEGLTHQILSTRNLLGELSNLLIAVLCARKIQFLLRVAHRRISLQQGATGASAQLLQRNLRNGGVVTRRTVGTLRLLLSVLLLAAAVHRVTASTHGRRRTHTEHAGYNTRRATALLSLDTLNCGKSRTRIVAILQLRFDVVLVHLRLLITRQGLRATRQEIRLARLGSNHQHHIGRTPIVLRGKRLRPARRSRRVLKLIDDHYVQIHVVLLRQSRNLRLQGSGITQRVRGIVHGGARNLHRVSSLSRRAQKCRTSRQNHRGTRKTCRQHCGTQDSAQARACGTNLTRKGVLGHGLSSVVVKYERTCTSRRACSSHTLVLVTLLV